MGVCLLAGSAALLAQGALAQLGLTETSARKHILDEIEGGGAMSDPMVDAARKAYAQLPAAARSRAGVAEGTGALTGTRNLTPEGENREGDVMGRRAVRTSWVYGVGMLLLVASPHAQEYPFNQRPTDVTVIMSTSRGKYDGTYTASQTSSTCGEVPMEMSFAGVAAFTVQFPDGGDSEISDVSFSSKTLVGGVVQTDKFSLSVSVKSPRIGQPAAYVLNTQQPKMTGTATLTTPSAGTARLKVAGVNDRGETIDLTVVCKPRR